MSKSLTLEAYSDIKQSALAHILEGGGIVPRSDDALQDRIARVAAAHYNGRQAEAHLTALLEQVPEDVRDDLREAAMYLASLYGDAAFALGCSVAAQLSYAVGERPPAAIAPEPAGVQ
jgi:hypothetical protein